MDKQLAGLDPKTKETYHRVMNTPIPAAPAANPATPAQTVPQAPPPPPVASPVEPAPQQIFTPQQPAEETPAQTVSTNNSQVFSSKKGVGKISPVIVVLGTVVFLAVYTLVWVKIFGIQLPFLP